MQRISFRSFIVFALVAAVIVTAGVVIYWREVNVLLEKDVRTHIADSGREAASDFDRLLGTDREILSVSALSIENTYPWVDSSVLSETLAHYARDEHFTLIGIALNDGQTFYSNPSIKPLSQAAVADILAHIKQASFYTVIRPPEKGKYSSAILIQAVPLDPNDSVPVGALFAVQKDAAYRDILALTSMGSEGHAAIIDRQGNLLLSYEETDSPNIFTSLEKVNLDAPLSLDLLRAQISKGKSVLVGYRTTENGVHNFLQFVPLETNQWYMVSAVPATYVEEQAGEVTKLSLILFGAVFLVFYFLIFFILRLRDDSNRRLFTTAFVDSLTGADNFARMTEQFEKALVALDGKAALVIFDINKFKVINDLHGYEKGNEVLKSVARVLREELAENERFCRSTADNFVMLLAFEDRRTFLKRLNALTTRLRRDCSVADSRLMLDFSFGIYEVTEEIPFYIMLDRAHLALEQAKQSMERIQFYEEQDRARVVAERRIESEMESALENREFEIYLQPQYDFNSGKMRGAEALVRWNRGEDRVARPDEFIPIFERNGFILKLDMFIFEEAARLLAKWHSANIPPVRIAVNFSRLHLNDSRFIPQIRRIAARHQVPAHLLEVELTESVIFNNLERAQEVMQGLHLYGFSVAMDDFGSGYSSLNVLKNLHFDSIKLDKEFLSGFEENPYAKKVIEGSAKMIKTLGASVVAEGIETREQVEFLRGIGCDLAQGYFFSRPVKAETFEQMIKEQ